MKNGNPHFLLESFGVALYVRLYNGLKHPAGLSKFISSTVDESEKADSLMPTMICVTWYVLTCSLTPHAVGNPYIRHVIHHTQSSFKTFSYRERYQGLYYWMIRYNKYIWTRECVGVYNKKILQEQKGIYKRDGRRLVVGLFLAMQRRVTFSCWLQSLSMAARRSLSSVMMVILSLRAEKQEAALVPEDRASLYSKQKSLVGKRVAGSSENLSIIRDRKSAMDTVRGTWITMILSTS